MSYGMASTGVLFSTLRKYSATRHEKGSSQSARIIIFVLRDTTVATDAYSELTNQSLASGITTEPAKTYFCDNP